MDVWIMGTLPDVLECGIQNALAAWHVMKFDAKHFFSLSKKPCLVSIVRHELWWQFIALGKHVKSISTIYPDSGNMRQLSTQSMSQKGLPTQPYRDNQVQNAYLPVWFISLFYAWHSAEVLLSHAQFPTLSPSADDLLYSLWRKYNSLKKSHNFTNTLYFSGILLCHLCLLSLTPSLWIFHLTFQICPSIS